MAVDAHGKLINRQPARLEMLVAITTSPACRAADEGQNANEAPRQDLEQIVAQRLAD
jgi:hypothetical protein